MLNGRTSTTTILSLSIIMLLMMMMMTIKDCEGWTAAFNGSTGQVVVEEDQEFMMDTEEHRRILTGNSGHISYDSLQMGNPACGKNCAGRYDSAGRNCKLFEYCKR